MKVDVLCCGEDGVLECGLGEGWMGEKRNELVCFAITEVESNGRDTEKKGFEVRE